MRLRTGLSIPRRRLSLLPQLSIPSDNATELGLSHDACRIVAGFGSPTSISRNQIKQLAPDRADRAAVSICHGKLKRPRRLSQTCEAARPIRLLPMTLWPRQSPRIGERISASHWVAHKFRLFRLRIFHDRSLDTVH